jgi:glycine cleavage system H protein
VCCDQLTSANAGICGISEHAQQELGDVVYVDLPDSGKSFSRGDPFGSVESVKAASSVYAPVDLTVKEVNAKLKDDSGLINKGAETEGWMLKVELKDPKQLDSLLDAAAYKKHCEEKAH